MKIYFKHKVIIIVFSSLFSALRKIFNFNISALTIFPIIFVKDQRVFNNQEYMNHELIHIRQYIETLFIGLIIIGILEYLYAFFFLNKKGIEAYYFMTHEQEAHINDQNLEYLKHRKWFTYYKYLNPKNKKEITLKNNQRIIL